MIADRAWQCLLRLFSEGESKDDEIGEPPALINGGGESRTHGSFEEGRFDNRVLYFNSSYYQGLKT